MKARRPDMKQYNFMGRLNEEDQANLKNVMTQDSLFKLVEKWLERTPFLNDKEFDFWSSYKLAIEKMLENDKKIIQENETLDNAQKEAQLANLTITGKTFEALLNEKIHNKNIEEGKKDCPTRQLKQLCLYYFTDMNQYLTSRLDY